MLREQRDDKVMLSWLRENTESFILRQKTHRNIVTFYFLLNHSLRLLIPFLLVIEITLPKQLLIRTASKQQFMDQNIIADWNDITVRGKAMNLEGKPFGFQTPNTFVLEE